ncbi:MAG TPA: hypothetical protein VIK13_00615 [Candidatus Limnocylindrales bacterium]
MTEATGRLLQEHEPAEEATDQELAAEVPAPATAAGPDPEVAADVPVPEPVAAQDPEPAADVPASAAAAGPDQAPAPALATPVPAPPRSARRARRAEVAEPVAGPATVATSGRPNALRLARLHLRMGQLLLARAQLEALAGRGDLDEAALLDLAEARWRTGDLAGAGEAAGALLAHGGEDGLALLIAAESVAALGRPGEARRMAARALAVTVGPLDPIFAGMPRNPIWPDDKVPAGDDPAAPEDGGAAGHPDHLGHVVRPRHAAPEGEPEGPASAAAAEAFAGGRAALAGGDIGQAALRLGVAMRLDAGFAEGVLEAVGAWDRDPALALVAGDALRLLGREAEAHAAFDRARGRP